MTATTYKLSFPIVAADGEEITELQLRRLKARELKLVDPQPADGKIGAVLRFVALMNNLPASTMDELDAADALALIGEASAFLAPGPGAQPSP